MYGVMVMGPGPGYEKHPEHTVELTRDKRRIQIRFQGVTIADTRNAVMVREAGYDPVAYIPRSDIRMELLHQSTRETHCPFKGYACYWSIMVDDKTAEDAAWAYPRSYEEVTELADCIAFDARFVEEIVVAEH